MLVCSEYRLTMFREMLYVLRAPCSVDHRFRAERVLYLVEHVQLHKLRSLSHESYITFVVRTWLKKRLSRSKIMPQIPWITVC